MIETDIWRVGIIHAPMLSIVEQGAIDNFKITWLAEEPELCFMADPFGIWRNGLLYLFVETYDYRTNIGIIEGLVLDSTFNIIERRPVLQEPWHLSYPFIFEADGEIWMLPESYKSGALNLYRAVDFPWCWQKEERFSFPEPAIDATPLKTADGWLMFYTPATPKPWRQSALKVAKAEHYLGHWAPLSEHPILIDKAGARMGGTALLHNERLILPTQDCSDTYGGAIQIRVSDDTTSSEMIPLTAPLKGAHIKPPKAWAPYIKGLHTLSAAGPVTLFDAKKTDRSFSHLWLKTKAIFK